MALLRGFLKKQKSLVALANEEIAKFVERSKEKLAVGIALVRERLKQRLSPELVFDQTEFSVAHGVSEKYR